MPCSVLLLCLLAQTTTDPRAPLVVVVPQGTPGYGPSSFQAPFMGGGFPAPFMGGFFPYGGLGRVGGALQGAASLTAATGQYMKDVQQARSGRYKANDAALDSAKKALEHETWYERRKHSLYLEDLAAEKRNELNSARNASDGSIWRGEAFNTLLKSINASPRALSGPNIPVEPRVVAGLNFMEKGSRGNVGLTKDAGRITWEFALGARAFDGPRNRFSETFANASSALQSGTAPNRDDIISMRNDLKALDSELERQFDSMSPGEYTTSRRQLRQLKEAVTGLSDPRVVKTHSNPRRNLRTVADIVGFMRSNGMEFGPATATGDRIAYSAFFFAIRDYERGVASYASR